MTKIPVWLQLIMVLLLMLTKTILWMVCWNDGILPLADIYFQTTLPSFDFLTMWFITIVIGSLRYKYNKDGWDANEPKEFLTGSLSMIASFIVYALLIWVVSKILF